MKYPDRVTRRNPWDCLQLSKKTGERTAEEVEEEEVADPLGEGDDGGSPEDAAGGSSFLRRKTRSWWRLHRGCRGRRTESPWLGDDTRTVLRGGGGDR